MDTSRVLDAISSLASTFALTRPERQQRRTLDASDFAALQVAGYHLLTLPAEHGGLWRGVRSTVRALATALRCLAQGDSSVALVASMHPAVLSYWLTSPEDLTGKVWKEQYDQVFRSASTGAWWGTLTSEPGSGGDLRKTIATARREAPGAAVLAHRISGRKHFGSGSGITSFMVTTAVPEGENEADWFFLDVRDVPWDGSQGLKLLAPWDGHGMTATQSHAMELVDFPATRFARRGRMLEVSRRSGPFIACLFAGVIVGVVEVAVTTATEQLGNRKLSAFEVTEWARARMEAWLVEQALEGMIRAVEERDEPRLETLQGKVAIAELAESVLSRICRILGGGTFSSRSPFGWWFEDVRALGFLRPPWGLAFETLAELQG